MLNSARMCKMESSSEAENCWILKLSKVPSSGHTGSNGNDVLGDRTYPQSVGDEDDLVSFCSRQEGKFGGVKESFTRPAKNPERQAERCVGG